MAAAHCCRGGGEVIMMRGRTTVSTSVKLLLLQRFCTSVLLSRSSKELGSTSSSASCVAVAHEDTSLPVEVMEAGSSPSSWMPSRRGGSSSSSAAPSSSSPSLWMPRRRSGEGSGRIGDGEASAAAAAAGGGGRITQEQEEEQRRRAGGGQGVQWVFLGCPGVGKGTYASRLSKLLQVPHIAMGDLVRQELSKSSSMAKQLATLMSQGQLLPDDIIIRLLSKRLEDSTESGQSGFILDGFPRTVHQAEMMQEVADVDLVVNLKLREDALIAKCLGRRICSQCGGNFNLARLDMEESSSAPHIFMPPLLPPPSCASKMTTRADDTEEVVRRRLRIYYEESKPVEDFYRKSGKLLDFEVSGGIPETWPRLLAALNIDEKVHTNNHDESQKMAA